jgi:hypothetical protein
MFLQSWTESLDLRWSELKITGLLIINSMYQAVKQIAIYFYGVPLLFVITAYYFYGLGPLGAMGYLIFLVLLMRPSVGIKNLTYFLNALSPLIGLLVIAYLLFDWLGSMFNQYAPRTAPLLLQLIGYEINWVTNFFVLSPFVILWMFWLFDARYGVADFFVTLKRALLMFFYHYPYFMLVYLLVRYVALPIAMISGRVAPGLPIVLVVVGIMPLYCAAIRYGYIRFLRQNFGRYYEDA